MIFTRLRFVDRMRRMADTANMASNVNLLMVTPNYARFGDIRATKQSSVETFWLQDLALMIHVADSYMHLSII